MRTNKVCAILGNAQRFEELLPLTNARPLATLPFDCKYRLIDFPLSSIVNANIHNVFMIFNATESRSVFDHIGGGKEWNLDSLQNRYFLHPYEDTLEKYDAGLPYHAALIDYLKKSESAYTVFFGTQMLSNIDLRPVLKIHAQQGNHMTMVYKKVGLEQVCDVDLLLDIDNTGAITDTHLKSEIEPTDTRVNLSMNMFIVQTQWLIDGLSDAQENDGPTDLKVFLRNNISSCTTSSYEYTGHLDNIFDIDSYYKANMDMLNAYEFRNLLYANNKIYTKLKNEVPSYFSEESNVRRSQFATGCIIKGTVEGSLISRRTMIDQGAIVRNSIIFASATIGKGAIVEHAILDKRVEVKPGVKIIGTQENPVVISKETIVENDILKGDRG